MKKLMMLVAILILTTIANGQNAPVTSIAVHEISGPASVQVPITITGMYDVKAISLSIKYDPAALVFTGITAPAFPELTNGHASGMIRIGAFGDAFNLASGTLCILNFTSNGTTTALTFVDHGESCEYAGGANITPFTDTPYDQFYKNGMIKFVDLDGKPTITVAAYPSSSVVCEGTTVVFSATVEYMGDNVTYQWRVNNIIQRDQTEKTLILPIKGKQIVRCTAKSNVAGKADIKSLPISVMSESIKIPSVSITQSPLQPCQSNNVTFTAAEINGSAVINGVKMEPRYQWRVKDQLISGATAKTFTYKPAIGDMVSVDMTSVAACVTDRVKTSNILTVMPLPAQGTLDVRIRASEYNSVDGKAITYLAFTNPKNMTYAFQWYVNGTKVGINKDTYTYNPKDGDMVHCEAATTLSGCWGNNPASSNKIKATVYKTGEPCLSGATVMHGGLLYNTVQIGEQCWIRENMNVGTMLNGTLASDNGVVEKYCYDNDANNCDHFGALYIWDEMMQYDSKNAQGICPDGWRVATTEDFEVLADFSKIDAGESTTTHVSDNYYNQSAIMLRSQVDFSVSGEDPNGNQRLATNETGFTAKTSGNGMAGTSGIVFANGGLKDGWIASYWTSSLIPGNQISPQWGSDNSLHPVYWKINRYNNALVPWGAYKHQLSSVRCIKN